MNDSKKNSFRSIDVIIDMIERIAIGNASQPVDSIFYYIAYKGKKREETNNVDVILVAQQLWMIYIAMDNSKLIWNCIYRHTLRDFFFLTFIQHIAIERVGKKRQWKVNFVFVFFKWWLLHAWQIARVNFSLFENGQNLLSFLILLPLYMIKKIIPKSAAYFLFSYSWLSI